MSDLFDRIAARAFGQDMTLRPRARSRFELMQAPLGAQPFEFGADQSETPEAEPARAATSAAEEVAALTQPQWRSSSAPSAEASAPGARPHNPPGPFEGPEAPAPAPLPNAPVYQTGQAPFGAVQRSPSFQRPMSALQSPMSAPASKALSTEVPSRSASASASPGTVAWDAEPPHEPLHRSRNFALAAPGPVTSHASTGGAAETRANQAAATTKSIESFPLVETMTRTSQSESSVDTGEARRVRSIASFLTG